MAINAKTLADNGLSLKDILYQCYSTDGINPSNLNAWKTCLKNVFLSIEPAKYNISDWANAIYNVWIKDLSGKLLPYDKRITHAQLIDGLCSLAFDKNQILTESNKYFIEIKMVVDAKGILTYPTGGAGQDLTHPVWVPQFVFLTDNQPTSTNENSNELYTRYLTPLQTIHWFASTQDGTNTIQLTNFEAGNTVVMDQMIEMPVIMPNATDCYTTVRETPPAGVVNSYRFMFTLNNNGKILYTFDPFLQDA